MFKQGLPTFDKVRTYIKIILIALLLTIIIVVIAQAVPSYIPQQRVLIFSMLIVCCFLLAVLECFNAFLVNSFTGKMIFFALDSVLLLAICVLTGNSFLSTLYCIVLTQCYMTVPKFRDKLILFGVSCGVFVVSFIVGWVFMHEGESIFNSVVEILSGAVFGLVALIIDFVVVEFFIRYNERTHEMANALKKADESRAELERAYKELERTAVFEERNRIAKDIHDNAGHSMTTIIMQTEAAKLIIDKDPKEAKKIIIAANMQARNAMEQMRSSVHLLVGKPNLRGIKSEIEEIISQTCDGTDIKVRSDLDELFLTEEAHRFVTNTIKESLSNGLRHGNATAFYIEFKKAIGGVQLVISDNGKGCGDITTGFGLNSMRVKCEQLGGTVNFSSENGEGFETVVSLPEQVLFNYSSDFDDETHNYPVSQDPRR